MMPMPFPYGNTNTAGQHLYAPAVCPAFGVNYNQYFASFYPNPNGLLPTPPRALMLPPTERNKNLNMRENKPIMGKNSLPTSSLMTYEKKNNINPNDFLTFIEQKSKPISELNPFANEFSVPKNNHHQIVPANNENSSSYRLIFDHLIEQSLQSIEAIKKASKTVSVNHVSTQYNQSIDQINRSTQTNDDNDQLEGYSSRSVELMNNLLEHFKSLLLLSNENDYHSQLKFMSHTCDELHYLISIINQLITTNKFSMNRDNLFSKMIKDRSIQSSPIIFGIGGRTRRLISSSISHSPTSSLSSRQIHPITMERSKICLLCQRPVDDSDDVMHKLCRLLSSPPNVSMNR